MKKFAVLLVAVMGLVSCQQEKTAYVDNVLLKENFNALQENNKDFDSRQNQLKSTLQADYEKFQKKVQDYQGKLESMSKDQQEKRRQELMQEQQQLQQKQQVQQSLFMQQKQKAQDSIEDILKTKIEDYAKSHNYTYIFGANDDDNLLYAADGKDITQDILDEVNNHKEKSTSKKPTTSKDTVSK